MIDLLKQTSDDTIALACCGAALFISAGIMYFSKYLKSEAAAAQASNSTPRLRLAQPEFKIIADDFQEKAA